MKLRADGIITGNVKRDPIPVPPARPGVPQVHGGCGAPAFQRLQEKALDRDSRAGTRKAIREQIVDYVKRGKIEVGLREFGTFSRHGHCRVCGYLARSYRRIQEIEQEVTEDVAELLEALGEEEKSHESGKKVDKMFCSALQFPAYRLLKNIFDTKICDEAHTLTGESMVYEAVSSIHTQAHLLVVRHTSAAHASGDVADIHAAVGFSRSGVPLCPRAPGGVCRAARNLPHHAGNRSTTHPAKRSPQRSRSRKCPNPPMPPSCGASSTRPSSMQQTRTWGCTFQM